MSDNLSSKEKGKSDEIIVNESFQEDARFSGLQFEELSNDEFESMDDFDLRLAAEVLSHNDQITELISYNKVRKNLEYSLPHQPEGALKILRDMNGSGLLADEVGLGKTITTGLVMKECIERGFAKRILILTPPSLVDQWVGELKSKFELDFKIVESPKDWADANFAIASIDRVKTFSTKDGEFRHSAAHSESWDLLVVDEAHKLKDKNSLRWRFVDKIPKKRFLVVTATPFQNDLLELYSLLHLLKRGHLGTVKEFRSQFLHKGNKRHPLNPKDLKRKLDEVMVRRKRAETEVAYTKRLPKIVPVTLSKEEMEVYNRMCDMLKEKYFRVSGREINEKLVMFSVLPKISSSSRAAMEFLEKVVASDGYHSATRKEAFEILEMYKKIPRDSKILALIEEVKKIIKADPKQKILLYTKYPSTLNYIREKLELLNLKCVSYMGGLDREQKSEIVRQFRRDASIMLSTETGSEGLNFQFCNNLINYDLPWNPMAVEQRIGRLDRIGQTRDMNIISLATKDTMEEHVVDLIINKMCCIGLVIGELPIILFNLGLDEKSKYGVQKIEEMLMNSFIDSRNNLEVFAASVEEIAKTVEKGVEDYGEAKSSVREVLDQEDGGSLSLDAVE